MSKYKPAKINTRLAKKVSIVSSPWDPIANKVIDFVRKSDSFSIDESAIVYDWHGHQYYAVKKGNRLGYIRLDAIEH